MQPLYAHSLDKHPIDQWRTLDQHLETVASQAALFAGRSQSADWAWNAAWLHDLGKASPQFQRYLLRENGLDDSQYDETGPGRINHSSAWAAWAEQNLPGPVRRTLAYLIAGHHAGLADYESAETGASALRVRIAQEGIPNLQAIPEAAAEVAAHLRPPSKPPPPTPTQTNPSFLRRTLNLRLMPLTRSSDYDQIIWC